jgi:RNA recognition motif-containing protein
MAYRAYVGNIPFSFTKADLENLFTSFGVVKSSDIIIDRETGRSRGFGFVELETAEQLAAAIQGMNGSLLNGRPLTVNEARERERGTGPSRGPGFGSVGGFPPRTQGDRSFNSSRPFGGERPAAGDRALQGEGSPRGFERAGGERGGAPGFTPRPGAPGASRTGPDRAPAGPGGPAGPAKRERAPDKAADRRHPKMDSYEREHKDWRRYSDDDDGWS